MTRRLLHTMVRVGDMQRSIDFYTKVMGMRLLRKSDNKEHHYQLAFLGYGEESETCVLELTYNEGVSSYEMGTAFGHLAIAVEDCYLACQEINQLGGTVSRPAGPVLGGDTVIAFITDPDGYKIELIQRQ